MKYAFIILFILFFQKSFCQSISIGQKLENSDFNLILNNTASKTSLNDFLDKPLIIEFWATWCGPCLQTLPHVQKMFDQYKDQINFLTVSDEDKNTVENFIKNNNYTFPVLIDENSIFSNSCGVQALPSTLIFNNSGQLLSITGPDKITPRVINELINGQELSIVKSLRGFDIENYSLNSIQSGIEEQVIFLPFNKDLPSFIHIEKQGEFANRRIILSNITVFRMYQNLYGFTDWLTKSEEQIQQNYNPEVNENLFYLDVIVPEGKENTLIEKAIETIGKNSLLKANIISKNDLVKSLVLTNPNLLPPLATGNELYSQTGSMKEMAQMFTAYNVFGQTVTDKTGLGDTRYVMDLNKFPTDPEKLAIIFSRIGIALQESTDNTSFLYLYE